MQSRSASRRVPIPERIRRHGRSRGPAEPSPISPIAPTAPDQEWRPAQPADAAFALTRAEADALREILQPSAGSATRPADPHEPGYHDPNHVAPMNRRWSVSPDSLRAGIEADLAEARDGGRVEVLRLPGALHSPEMWHVRLVGVQPDAVLRIEAAVRLVRRRGEHDVR